MLARVVADVIDQAASSPAGTVEFPCRKCGADLHFAPGIQSLRCPYCDHVETIEASTKPIVEYDLAEGIDALAKARGDELNQNGKTIQCSSCGAVAVVDTQAQRCAFCGSPSVQALQEDEKMVVPESVLPFAIEAEVANRHFLEWVKSRWFAPNDLGQQARRLKLVGVYLPYWTYDSETTSDYQGYRGTHYYTTESYTDSEGNRQTRTVQRTRWSYAQGQVARFFDDVLVPASPSLDESLSAALDPWDLSGLKPFSPAYLSGLVAERYQLPLEDGFEKAKQAMSVIIESDVRRDIGGDVQRISQLFTAHEDTTFKHILLPVWISSYRYRKELYQFAVNAQTGEVVGRRPYSWIKIALAVLAGIALIGVILWLRRYYG